MYQRTPWTKTRHNTHTQTVFSILPSGCGRTRPDPPMAAQCRPGGRPLTTGVASAPPPAWGWA